MNSDEATHYLENMKWLKGFDNTTIGDKTVGEIIDEIIAILKNDKEKELIKG